MAGDELPNVGPWAKEKLARLRKDLAAYTTIMSKDRPAGLEGATKRLKKTVNAVQKIWAKSTPAAGADAKRPADRAHDSAWSALAGRLEAYASLPEEHFRGAARAKDVYGRLFPDGLAFLKLPYKMEWAESNKRLNVIASNDLEGELDALCGKEFLAEVKRTFKIYGEVLGITKALAEDVDAEGLREPMMLLRRAMQSYVLQLTAAFDGDQLDAGALAAALKPIDDLRFEVARRGGAAANDQEEAPSAHPTPHAPVAPVAPGPGGEAAAPVTTPPRAPN